MDKWDEAVVPNIYHSFEITNTQVDSNYLQQYFWSGALDKQLRKVLTSSARDDGLLNIKADTFFSLNVDLPSLSEQKKVASILTSMDKTIDDKKRKLTQIQFLKISLMQDLLTGKVRVKVN
jgi:type I restriction enzyme S subunit